MKETYLHGNKRVEKNHPRIVFRGRLDSLQADILEAQVFISGERDFYKEALQEILDFTRDLLAADVNEKPFSRGSLFGLGLEELHKQASSCTLPNYTMGELPIRLNTLRTRVREIELLAVGAVQNRDDILYALNRLSSAVYWLFCQSLL